MPGSLLPAALPGPGRNREVAVRVTSQLLPNTGEIGLEDAAAAQKNRLQGACCHHGKGGESGSSQERVGQGCEPAGIEWVAGGLQREPSLTFGVNNAPRYTLSA